jgi:tRNA/rRNA methyltransferase
MPGLEHVRIVLVEPLYSGNVGSVCRAMANMGLADLALVSPKIVDGWQEGERLACHATDILAGRREFATLAEAVADCAAVAGTTARLGLYRQHVRPPREAASDLVRLAAGGRVALVFGREDKGLFNEEIALCTHLLRIPTAPGYVSLNLAQAVLVCCYELFLALGAYEAPQEKSEAAPAGHRIQMMRMWREMLLKIGFMRPDTADHMMQGLQRIFSRGAVTTDDVHILMGVARQVTWAANECGARSAECGARSAECGARSAECGVRSAECGVRSAECGVRSAECGARSAE